MPNQSIVAENHRRSSEELVALAGFDGPGPVDPELQAQAEVILPRIPRVQVNLLRVPPPEQTDQPQVALPQIPPAGVAGFPVTLSQLGPYTYVETSPDESSSDDAPPQVLEWPFWLWWAQSGQLGDTTEGQPIPDNHRLPYAVFDAAGNIDGQASIQAAREAYARQTMNLYLLRQQTAATPSLFTNAPSDSDTPEIYGDKHLDNGSLAEIWGHGNDTSKSTGYVTEGSDGNLPMPPLSGYQGLDLSEVGQETSYDADDERSSQPETYFWYYLDRDSDDEGSATLVEDSASSTLFEEEIEVDLAFRFQRRSAYTLADLQRDVELGRHLSSDGFHYSGVVYD